MSERKSGGVALAERADQTSELQSKRNAKLHALADSVLRSPDFNFSSYLEASGMDTGSIENAAPAAAPERILAEPLTITTPTGDTLRTPTDTNLPPRSPEMTPPTPPIYEDGGDGGGERTTPEFTVVALDMSRDARDLALDIADKRIIEELSRSGKKWYKRVFSNALKGGVLRDYYRSKYAKEARREMGDAGDILVGTVESAQDRTRAETALFDRFGTNLNIREVIAEAAGERRDILEANSPFATESKNLIEQFVLGTIPRDDFVEAEKRLVNAHHDSDPNTGKDKKNGRAIEDTFRTSNLLAVAEGIKTAATHANGLVNTEKLQELLGTINFATGETAIGARTEARRDVLDTITNKLGAFGSLLPEEVTAGIALAAAIAWKSGVRLAGELAGMASFGVAGAVIGGVRGYRQGKQEFAQHERERAMSQGDLDPADKRRQRMESGLTMMGYGEAITSLESALASVQRDPANPNQAPGQAALDQALNALAAIELRDAHGNNDLFRAGEEGFVIKNQEVQKLGILRATLKVELRRELAANGQSIDVDNLTQERAQPVADALNEVESVLSKRREVRNKYIARRAIGGAGTGAATSLAFGFVMQEAVASVPSFISEYSGNTQSLAERIISGDDLSKTQETALSGAYDSLFGIGDHVPADTARETTFVGPEAKSTVEVSQDHSFFMNPDGQTFRLEDPYGRATIDNVPINPDGSLPESAQKMLTEKGMNVSAGEPTYGPSKTEELTLGQYMERNVDQTKAISRHWLDTGTSAILDKTGNVVGGIEGAELGLHWTGNGLGAGDGSYHMNVSNMDMPATDRYGNAVNWADSARSGTLYLAVSPSVETQATPLMVPVMPDGAIAISPDHPAAQFFEQENGRAVFKGAYAEVVHDTGAVNASGASKVQVMATVVGTGEGSTGTITQTIPGEKYTHFSIQTDGYIKPDRNFMPFAGIPLVGFNPIKPLRREPGQPTPPIPPSGGGGGDSPSEPQPPTPPAPGIRVEDMPPLVTAERPPVPPAVAPSTPEVNRPPVETPAEPLTIPEPQPPVAPPAPEPAPTVPITPEPAPVPATPAPGPAPARPGEPSSPKPPRRKNPNPPRRPGGPSRPGKPSGPPGSPTPGRPGRRPARRPGSPVPSPATPEPAAAAPAISVPTLPLNAPTRLPISVPATSNTQTVVTSEEAFRDSYIPLSALVASSAQAVTRERVLERRSRVRRSGSPVTSRVDTSSPQGAERPVGTPNSTRPGSRLDAYMQRLISSLNAEVANMPERVARTRAAGVFGENGFTIKPKVAEGVVTFEVAPNAIGRAIARETFNAPRALV